MRTYCLAWKLATLLFCSFVVLWSGPAAGAVLSQANPMIFWRNISTGENTAWYMNGATHTGSAAGPWTWSCAGVNGGATASCSANMQTWTVTPSGRG